MMQIILQDYSKQKKQKNFARKERTVGMNF